MALFQPPFNHYVASKFFSFHIHLPNCPEDRGTKSTSQNGSQPNLERPLSQIYSVDIVPKQFSCGFVSQFIMKGISVADHDKEKALRI